MISKRVLRTGFALILAAFFVVGGIANIFASETIIQDYQRWGYPSWFHYVTGFLELVTAVLLVLPRTRLVGSGLGGSIMAAAIASLLLNGEYGHAVAPIIVLLLVGLNALITFRFDRSLDVTR